LLPTPGVNNRPEDEEEEEDPFYQRSFKKTKFLSVITREKKGNKQYFISHVHLPPTGKTMCCL
jgi:hypothetical protein